jgi:DNA-binding transcriptional LysR family regulator
VILFESIDNPIWTRNRLSLSETLMDRFEAMSILVATAETGSFSAAGRKLGMPLPTVSRKVADLEAHLGVRLLVRSTRKLEVTEAGTTYIEACRRILEQVNEAEQAAAGEHNEPRGDLVIAAPVVFGRLYVLPIVNDFLAQYPEVKVRLVLSDHNLNLVTDHIDLALRVGTLPDSSLVATRLGTTCRVVCGSPQYFAAHGTPKSLADLVDHACISFEALAQGPAWKFAQSPQQRKERSVEVRPRLVVNTAEAAVDAAIAGVGLAHVLSYQAWPAYQAGALKLVLREFDPDPVPVSFVYTAHRLLPLKSRLFLDMATPRLRKVLEKLTKKNPPALAKADSAAGAYA